VVLHLDPGDQRPAEELWFVDPRTFGEVVVFDPSNLAAELPELAKLGIDPVNDGLRRAQLTALALRARQPPPSTAARAAAPGPPAQGAAARPARRRRDRQHLLRRGAAPRPAAARSDPLPAHHPRGR